MSKKEQRSPQGLATPMPSGSSSTLSTTVGWSPGDLETSAGVLSPRAPLQRPLSTEYVRKLQNQIKTLVDSIAQPVLNSDLTPAGKAAVFSYHLLNAILVLHLHIAEVYYDDPDKPTPWAIAHVVPFRKVWSISRVDWDALGRSRQAAEQLAEVGIELGGYRLAPPLGDMQSVPPGVFDQRLR